MNKNSLRQIIVTEMILADVEGGDRVPPKKRSLFEMMDDSYLDELEDGRLAHSMKTVEGLFEAEVRPDRLGTWEPMQFPSDEEMDAAAEKALATPQDAEERDGKKANIRKRQRTAEIQTKPDDVETAINPDETEEQRNARFAQNRKDYGLGPKLTVDEEKELKNKVGAESIDLALTIAGFISGPVGALFAAPTGGISLVVGAVPDIINGIRKVNRGEYFDGVLDFICAIPGVGEGAAIIKGVHEVEKIVKLIALAKKLKGIAKAVSFIKKMINKFVKDDRKKGALDAFDDIMSGDLDRIKKAISATEPEPVPEPVAIGGLEYLDSLAQEELNGNKSGGVAESKNASGLSLIGMLYGD